MNTPYRWLVGWIEVLLSIPVAPGAPPGDEGTTRVFRASPRYYYYRLATWLIGRLFSVIVLLGALAATAPMADARVAGLGRAITTVLLTAYALQTLTSWVALRLDYEKRWYLVTDRSLRIRHGVMTVSEMTVTFANIQNLSISQGPLQRLLGISDLRVETAGGSTVATTGEHAGVSFHTALFEGVDNAEEIRALVQQRQRRVQDSGLGDPDDDAIAREPSAGQPSDVLLALRELNAEAQALHATAAQR